MPISQKVLREIKLSTFKRELLFIDQAISDYEDLLSYKYSFKFSNSSEIRYSGFKINGSYAYIEDVRRIATLLFMPSPSL